MELHIPEYITGICNGIAYLLDNAKLDACFRDYALYGIREAFEVINATDQNILSPSVLEIGQNLQPKVGSFAFGDIHAQEFFMSVFINA